MSLIIKISALLCVLVVSIQLLCATSQTNDEDRAWLNFKRRFNKSYEDPIEDATRRAHFLEHKKYIEDYNDGDHGITLAINSMTDWSDSELSLPARVVQRKHVSSDASQANRLKATSESFINEIMRSIFEVPSELDWSNDTRRVGPIKNQGNCNSCWAFATTGLLEGQQFKKGLIKESVTPLSEQQLVDCELGGNCSDGGDGQKALESIRSNGGIQSAASYPYKGKQDACSSDENELVMSVLEALPLSNINQETLKAIVALYGPVHAEIGMPGLSRSFYESGILRSEHCKDVMETNHEVLIVGYGVDTQKGLNYWIVRNSWGRDWGQGGYFKIEAGQNVCLIEESLLVALV